MAFSQCLLWNSALHWSSPNTLKRVWKCRFWIIRRLRSLRHPQLSWVETTAASRQGIALRFALLFPEKVKENWSNAQPYSIWLKDLISTTLMVHGFFYSLRNHSFVSFWRIWFFERVQICYWLSFNCLKSEKWICRINLVVLVVFWRGKRSKFLYPILFVDFWKSDKYFGNRKKNEQTN